MVNTVTGNTHDIESHHPMLMFGMLVQITQSRLNDSALFGGRNSHLRRSNRVVLA